VELSPYSNRDSPDKIWFLRRARGDSHVERFIERLDPQTRRATERLFDQTELSGLPRRSELFRHLEGDVFEFKVHRAVAVRYVGFRADIGMVITRAVRKPQTAVLQRLIRQTQWLRDEYERTRP
jgi:hypothetical protein